MVNVAIFVAYIHGSYGYEMRLNFGIDIPWSTWDVAAQFFVSHVGWSWSINDVFLSKKRHFMRAFCAIENSGAMMVLGIPKAIGSVCMQYIYILATFTINIPQMLAYHIYTIHGSYGKSALEFWNTGDSPMDVGVPQFQTSPWGKCLGCQDD